MTRRDYQVVTAPTLAHTSRTEFSEPHFSALVTIWQGVVDLSGTVLTDASPWAYLRKFSASLPAHVTAPLESSLAHLALPSLHVLLVTSGREIGRRGSPLSGESVETIASRALGHMRELTLLDGPLLACDTSTGGADGAAARLDRQLRGRFFRVDSVDVQGVAHSDLPYVPAGSASHVRTCLTSSGFSTPAAQAHVVSALFCTLHAGLRPFALRCPGCKAWHCDSGWHATHLHRVHHCAECGKSFTSPFAAVGNPLAVLSPKLDEHNSEPRLGFSSAPHV